MLLAWCAQSPHANIKRQDKTAGPLLPNKTKAMVLKCTQLHPCEIMCSRSAAMDKILASSLCNDTKDICTTCLGIKLVQHAPKRDLGHY